MRRVSFLAGVVGLLVMVSVGEAVRPRGWVFATQKDFSKGSFEGTVVDSYGQLMLGRELSMVETGKESEIVTGLVEAKGGAVFAAVNGDEGGKVYRIDGKKGKADYVAPKDFEITAIAEDGEGNLLVALSGKTARVVALTEKKWKGTDLTGKKWTETTRFENENVDYVWAIAVGKDGRVFVGTGPEGKVYQVGEDKAGKEVLDTPAKNVTALGFDKDDNLVVGTDGKGLVIRVDGKTGKGFVLLDAGKVDVNAIVRDKDGALFVATAKVDAEAKEGDEPETKSKPGGSEPEPVEPADGDGKGKQGAAVRNVPGVLGVQDDLASALKKLAEKGKDGPTTKKKPGLPQKHGSTTKHRPADSKEQNGNGGEGEGDDGPADASCVYRISADGAVTTVMQEGDMNYALALAGEDLLIGTGGEGKVYRYRADDESVALVARLKEEHVTAILATKGGEVLLGTANMGQVYRLGAGLAKSGTFTSQVLDAGNTASWGQWAGHVATPEGSKVTVATRTGNTRSVEGVSEKFWSEWSKEMEIGGKEGKVGSPAAKYLQFRVTLTGDGKGASPVVNGMKLGYQAGNVAPRIKKVGVETAGGGSEGDEGGDEERSKDLEAPPTVAQVSWEASDPNGDTLVYRVFYRAAGKGAEGKEDVWTPLAKELKDSVYEWDTRGVADGAYQVKVIASDKLDNAPGEAKEAARVSGTFVVDHNPPAIGELKVALEGNKVTISGEAKDAASAVVDVRFQVDGQIAGAGDWQPGAASDKIFDSAQEAFTVVTGPLSVGGHRVTVRATDSQGNSSYKTVTVVVKP